MPRLGVRVNRKVKVYGAHTKSFGVRISVMVLMKVVVLAVAFVEIAMQICPDEPTNISVLSAVEVLHAPHSECEKDDAK